jgi:hypothetical protein
MAMRHAYQQANNRVSSSSDRKMMICGGTALRVDALMPGRRWQLRPSLTRDTKPNGPCNTSNQATVDAIACSSAEHAPQLDTKTYGYWPSC